MNHLKDIQKQKLEELKKIIKKEELQYYYNTHTYKETAQYYKDTYGCSIANLKSLYTYFNISKKGKGYNLSNDREKVRQGMIAKYGADNPQKVTHIKEKTRSTNLEKYGVPITLQAEKIKEKIRETNLEKYGVENVYQAEEIKEKIKQTCLEKYGVEYACQAETTKAKQRKTKYERYGNPGYHNYEKMKQTNIEKYGQEFPCNIEKTKQTCLKKYGVDNPAKLREVHIKAAKTRATAIASDGTKFDSNWEVLVYEYAKDKGYCIEMQVPVNYNDTQVTFIDFRINGHLYEVKGTHLLNNCWKNKNVDINQKLDCYKENSVIIITDVSKVNELDEALQYIDIYNLNF